MIEALKPLTIRLRSGELHLKPGVLVELADEQARRLLAKAPNRVRAVASPGPVTVEVASPNPKAIYWETAEGRILGPAVPEYLARHGDTFWIVTTFDGQARWINADRLRSRKAFEDQPSIREVESYSLILK